MLMKSLSFDICLWKWKHNNVLMHEHVRKSISIWKFQVSILQSKYFKTNKQTNNKTRKNVEFENYLPWEINRFQNIMIPIIHIFKADFR